MAFLETIIITKLNHYFKSIICHYTYKFKIFVQERLAFSYILLTRELISCSTFRHKLFSNQKSFKGKFMP